MEHGTILEENPYRKEYFCTQWMFGKDGNKLKEETCEW